MSMNRFNYHIGAHPTVVIDPSRVLGSEVEGKHCKASNARVGLRRLTTFGLSAGLPYPPNVCFYRTLRFTDEKAR